MAVPNIFGSATSAIPLSQLDTNFATPVTIGNTAVQLGNTVTSFGNVTLTNVTISSGNVTVTGANVSGTANVSTLIVTGNQTSLGNVAITGNISANIATFSAGSNTAPSITTTGDTNTGIFFPAADTIAFSEGGVESMRIDSSGNVGIGTSSPNASYKMSITGNSASIYPGILFTDTNAGGGIFSIYGESGALKFRDSSAGATRMTIDSSGNVGIGTSSPSFKLDVANAGGLSIRANNTSSTAVTQFRSTNTLTTTNFGVDSVGGFIETLGAYPTLFYTNSAERARIDSSGNLLVGTTSNDAARFRVRGSGTTTATYSVKISNSADSIGLQLRDDGFFGAPYIYAKTSGSAANVFVDSDGTCWRSTSSLKYKEDVQDATFGLQNVLSLRSVTYKQKSTDSNGAAIDQRFGGLIAEEVHEAGLTEFVQYAPDGTPDALHYGNMVSLCIKAIQELKAIVDAQAVEIAALKGTA